MARALGRLKTRPEFLHVAAARRKWATPGLVLQVAGRKPIARARGGPVPAEAVRVGYTASRKVGGSVVRNRALRRLRAAAATVLPLHAAAGADYVVIARAGTVRRPFPALLADLEEALRRLHVWQAAPPRDEATSGSHP